MLCDGDENTHEHCHAISAAASGPSANEYSMASTRASWTRASRATTVAMFTTWDKARMGVSGTLPQGIWC